MMQRLDYYQYNRYAVNGLVALGKHLSAIDKRLRALVEIRVSQINGCLYCIDLHTREARAAGETQQRLDSLPAWYEAPYFDAREKAALAWAEAVTRVAETHAPDAAYETLNAHFSPAEVVDLTLIIATINAWNRIAVSFRRIPDPEPVQA